MKTKRFLSLLLALVMSLSLAAPAFAAEPDDPDEGIMPLLQIFPDGPVSGNGSYRTMNFSSTPRNGKTIHVWFQNTTNHDIEVYLYRTDSTEAVLIDTAPASSNWSGDYTDSTADSAIYYVVLQLRGNYTIQGRLAVAQYP